MSIFGLIKDKKEFNISGKKLVIIGDASGEIIEIIHKIFVRISELNTALNPFQTIEIHLFKEDYSYSLDDTKKLKRLRGRGLAYVGYNDMITGKNIININILTLEGLLKEYGADEVIDSYVRYLGHELTHVLQYQKGKLKQIKESEQRLYYKLKMKYSIFKPPYNIKIVRSLLMDFMANLQAEGLARYTEEIMKGTNLDQRFFDNNYHELKDTAEKSRKLWNIYIKKTEKELSKFFGRKKRSVFKSRAQKALELLFRIFVHEFGLHMVNAILYFDKRVTFDDLIKMGYLKFIKKYEKCMRDNGLQPIVSHTSGAGILDYKQMLQQWSNLLK